nr:hypothetical protein Iba_chr05dCG7480 [Ipomoea batatas]
MRQQRHSMEFRPIRSFQIIHSQIQKNELKEAGDSRWYHSAETIVLEINANQEESSKEVDDDDRPLIFHCKRASASLLASGVSVISLRRWPTNADFNARTDARLLKTYIFRAYSASEIPSIFVLCSDPYIMLDIAFCEHSALHLNRT